VLGGCFIGVLARFFALFVGEVHVDPHWIAMRL
jgi:hypothetical protein